MIRRGCSHRSRNPTWSASVSACLVWVMLHSAGAAVGGLTKLGRACCGGGSGSEGVCVCVQLTSFLVALPAPSSAPSLVASRPLPPLLSQVHRYVGWGGVTSLARVSCEAGGTVMVAEVA